MSKREVSEVRKKILEIHEQNELEALEANKTRARSFSVGTCGGGLLEVSIRGDSGFLWYQLGAVEAVEVIQQLAAGAGLDVALRPRQDFAAWRSWNQELPPSVHWLGTAPWQLSDEGREELAAIQARNLKVLRDQKEDQELLNESKSDESE